MEEFITYLKKTFAALKKIDANEAKLKFSYIWAVFASKKLLLKNNCVFELDWREISSCLSMIYNEWYSTQFTQEAFYNNVSPIIKIGESSDYDEIIKYVTSGDEFVGLYIIETTYFVPSTSNNHAYKEIDVLTGKTQYLVQEYNRGKKVNQPRVISKEEFENICFSQR